MALTKIFHKKTLAGLSTLIFLLCCLFSGVWFISTASDSERYTVETNIAGSEITAMHPNNLIKNKIPYFIKGNEDGGEGDISEMTDGNGTKHIDFWARDSKNLRFVYKLDRMETIGSLLYAGYNGVSNATGKYEFYISDEFNHLDDTSFFTSENLILSYDNTTNTTVSQKFTFTPDNRPFGRYIGIRITDVSVAGDNDNARVAEIGVYPPKPDTGEIIVDAESERGGRIIPPGKVPVATGETQVFTVSADAGYEVESVLVNGEEVQLTDGEYQFTAGEQNAEIRVKVKNLLGYWVDTGIKDSDIKKESALYTSNLIKDKQPIFVSRTPEQDISKLTDGIGAGVNQHVDFYVSDSANLRMVYDLGSVNRIQELLYAGHNSTTHTTGKYEFYVFNSFDPQNETFPWPSENLVASYDNTVKRTNAQKIVFEQNKYPLGRYVGIIITDVSVAENDNNARIAEIGVYGEQVPTFTITADAGQGGSISPSGAVPVLEGGSVTFTVTPDNDYAVDVVMVNGEEVQLTNGKYVFENVQANATITVTFKFVGPLLVDTNITADDISESHDDNLIKGFLPYFVGEHTGNDGEPSKLTDGIGATEDAHMDYYAEDADLFRLVYDLKASATIDALLCAGPTVSGHVLGKYEFYVSDTFDDETFWTEDNKVYTFDNTEIQSVAQKIYFYSNKPVGRYVGIRFTDVSVAGGNDNCVRISELGVYGTLENKAPTPNVTFHAVTRTLSGTEDGQKYRIDGGQWTDIVNDLSGVVTGACTIEIYMPSPREGVEDSDIQTIEVGKFDKPTVSASNETFAGRNDGKISGVNATMEYRRSDGQWQNITGNTVENLAPGTYHVRVKASGTTLESDYAVVVIEQGQEEYTQQTITDSGQNVSISGLLTEGAVLTVEPITDGNIDYEELFALIDTDENSVIAAFDVSITEGEYSGSLTLTFTVGEQYNGKTLTIYHKNMIGQIENYTAECVDGKITITVDELSPFLIAAPKDGEPTSNGDTTSTGDSTTITSKPSSGSDSAPTGEQSNIMLWLVLSLISIAGIFTFILHCRKSKAC